MVEAQQPIPLTAVRLLAGFAVAPLAAVILALVAYDALCYTGTLSGGAPINSIDAALAIGVGVGIIAVGMAACAVPLIMWLASRGPVSFGRVLLLGAALGNVPFAIIVLGIVAAHPFSEVWSGDIGRFWYGFPGAVQRVALGLISGMGSASLFWIVGIRDRAGHEETDRSSLRTP
ncbi:MAG TPA: hypothetical protein VGJ29_10195 [Vicinamibacterales bacterium]|jgi:hypothetical protein